MLLLTDDTPAAGDLAAGWDLSPDIPSTGTETDVRLEPLWRRFGLTAAPLVRGETTVTIADGFWSGLLIQHDAPDSQFDALRELLGAGLALSGPLACLALAGSGFHGNRGRTWRTEPGNLHLSVAIPLDLPADRSGPPLTMLPAVAVTDAITACLDRGDGPNAASAPGIKWVNDILINGRKVSGVLTSTLSEGRRLESVVFGIGINLASAPRIRPTPFVPRTGCLRDLPGAAVLTLPVLTGALLAALADRITNLIAGDSGNLVTAYRDRSLVVGRDVVVWREGHRDEAPPAQWPAPLGAGRVVGIGDDLRLHLSGRDEPVESGRLAFLEDWQSFSDQEMSI